MAFKALFIAHAGDAEAEKHRATIETPKLYKLFVVVVKNEKEAEGICKEMAEKEKIDAVLLCPGFNHVDVANIQKVVGEKIGVFVARGDAQSYLNTMERLKEEGFFSS